MCHISTYFIFAGKSYKEGKKRAFELSEQLGIASLAKRPVSKLSGGQKQRVAIARALMNKPILILADEPTGALDSENSCLIIDLLLSVTDKDSTLILATHDISIANMCDEVLHIKDGIIVPRQ